MQKTTLPNIYYNIEKITRSNETDKKKLLRELQKNLMEYVRENRNTNTSTSH